MGRVTGPFAFLAVQQKEVTQSPSTSTITLVTSTQPAALVSSSGSASTLASAINADLPIATASADVAADIAKYTSKVSEWVLLWLWSDSWAMTLVLCKKAKLLALQEALFVSLALQVSLSVSYFFMCYQWSENMPRKYSTLELYSQHCSFILSQGLPL